MKGIRKMKVCVVGLGYIGLPTAMMLASHGVQVEAVDYNKELVEKLQNGHVTFEESGIEELFDKAVKGGIKFVTEYPVADMYIVAVPTPYIEETKKIDATYVKNAVEQVVSVCAENAIVVVESTISPGTIDKEVRPVIAKSGKKISIAHAPERIIPGNMVYELVNNSRTIGSDTVEVGEKIREVYASFCQGEIVLTDIKTAEMSKVVENTFRDINIAFANELAKICRKGGMNVHEIIRIANKHPRVNILQPGPGVGGHCISVDPWFLVGDFPEEAQLVYQARKVNSEMPRFVLDRIQAIMSENGIQDFSRVGLYGLTYKENVDDVRESPTLQLLEVIEKENLPMPAVYDPMVTKKMTERQYSDFDEFLSDTDIIVILVGHTHLKENMEKLNHKIVLDTRNITKDTYKL